MPALGLCVLSRQPRVQEAAHEPRDSVAFLFEREMAGVEQMQLDVFEIARVGARPLGRKDLIVLAPDNQRRRLMPPEVLLPLSITIALTCQ